MPQADREYLIFTPTAPSIPIYYNKTGWTKGGGRCPRETSPIIKLDTVPMPEDFFIEDGASMPKGNSAAAFLREDGRTILQTQPVARCRTTVSDENGKKYATSWPIKEISDIYTNEQEQDLYGGHGGSGLSTVGGSLRLGEMRPGSIGPKHALKIEVDTAWVMHRCDSRSECFVWPERGPDSYATTQYGRKNPRPERISPYMKMGALLTIPASVNLASLGLKSEPGRQLAWTLQNYGAYIVDDKGGPGFSFNLEMGSAGSKLAEFKVDYGYSFEQRLGFTANPWMQDVKLIMGLLQVVINNAKSDLYSGGGTPLQATSPALRPPF